MGKNLVTGRDFISWKASDEGGIEVCLSHRPDSALLRYCQEP